MTPAVYDLGTLGDHVCTDPACVDPTHLPDRDDDTVWGAADDASWVEFDHRAERRADV